LGYSFQGRSLIVRSIAKAFLIGAGAALGASWAIQSLVRRARWFDFAGKTVLIAGGSRGLGLVLARQLVRRGAKVAISARTEEDLRTAADELRQEGGHVLAVTCDIRNPHQVQTAIQTVRDNLGPVEVLFNVAGIIQAGPFDAMTLEDFQEAMAINCWGPLHAVLAVLPDMRRRKWGRIVNIASIGGKQAVPHLLPYDTSKFALVGLSQGLRTELAADGILVTTASPTLMRTGSPRNAIFKGRHREEYAWFSMGAGMPLVSMSANRAAQQILTACQAGDADVFITNWLNPPVLAARFAPLLTTEILLLINRLLPSMGGIGKESAWGYESESPISPSLLTTLNEQAAACNNELQPRTSIQSAISER
jgi:NAD(P)-dependent dehydrogenase (short-subunit alcohol dehydrogenase family)